MFAGHVFVQSLMSGLALGLVYSLVAMGFTLTTGVMNYVNFAHGQLTMLAMYVVYVAATSYQLDPFLSIFIAVPVVAVFAAVIFLITGRWAVRRAHGSQILATIGVLLIIQSVASLIFGADTRVVAPSYETASYHIGQASLSKPLMWGALIALVSAILIFLLLRRTHLGRVLRATADNTTGALLCGINASRTYLVAMLIAAALEGIAGGIFMVIGVVSPNVGFNYMLRAFVIAVVAGLGSIAGAAILSLVYGVLESFANLEFGSQWSTIFVFGVLVLSIAVRPSGLFPAKAVRRA